MVETRKQKQNKCQAKPLPPGPLTARGLQGLSEYKYKASGYTILDHIHNPAWNALVELLPMWLAPNLITLAGTMAVVLAYLLSIVYCPTFSEEAPRWVYWVCGFAVFLYVNLDCMDGKQARRTKSSSPLGQLFDHGCDALALGLLLTTVRIAMRVPWGWEAVGVELSVMVPWLMAHWEEYHSGIMLYSNGYWGVMEGNYAIVLMHWASAIFGPGLWDTPLPFRLAGVPILQNIQVVRHAMLAIVFVAAVLSAAGQLHRVLVFPTASLSTEEKGHKELGHGAAALHLLHLLVFIVLGSMWMTADISAMVKDVTHSAPGASSPGLLGMFQDLPSWVLSRLQGNEEAMAGAKTWLAAGAMRVPELCFGLTYAMVATQLILAHMAKEPFTPFTPWWPMAVLVLGSVTAVLKLADPVAVGLVLLVVTLVGYTQYVLSLINQICKFLGIECLRIKKIN